MRKNSKGFTLIEMLIVIAIIAILVAIAIPTFSGALTKAKEAADEANIRSYYGEVVIKNLTDNVGFPDAYDDTAKPKLNYSDKLTWALDKDGVLTIKYDAEKLNDLELTAEPISIGNDKDDDRR